MTAPEAIEICRLKAEGLNYPWSSETAVATRRRVWPFPPFWRVVTCIQSDNLTIKMVVHERSREARITQAIWAASSPQPIQRLVFFLFCIKLIVSGCLAWLVARYILLWPIWGATLLAVPCAYAGLMIYEGIAARIRSKKYEDDDDEKDETNAT